MAKENIGDVAIEPFLGDTNKTADKCNIVNFKQPNVNDSSHSQTFRHYLSLKTFIRIMSYILIICMLLAIILPLLIGKPIAPEHTEHINRMVRVINSLAILAVSGNATDF